jgi:hypothetical protein
MLTSAAINSQAREKKLNSKGFKIIYNNVEPWTVSSKLERKSRSGKRVMKRLTSSPRSVEHEESYT